MARGAFPPRAARCARFALAVGASLAPLTAQARWTELAAPPGRAGHAMAHDMTQGTTLLHGGEVPSSVPPRLLGDTWLHDGAGWHDVTSPSGPGVRSGHAMAFDLVRNVIVLFGGHGQTLLGDTWEWRGSGWTRVAATGPSPRSEHAMAFDVTRNTVVLFGGADASGVQQDTWEWNGSAWSPLGASNSPPPLRRHAMVTDLGTGTVVLHGGTGPQGLSNATWRWNGSTWTQVTTPTAPPLVEGHALAYDIARQTVVLFGGYAGTGTGVSDETWRLDAVDWRRVPGTVHPSARGRTAAVFDLRRAETVVFGGTLAGTAYADAWGFDGTAWGPVDGSPLARSGHAMAESPGGGVVLFGGWDGVRAFLADTWHHGDTGWASIPGTGPAARHFHAMAHDPVRDVVVLFGGFDGSVRLADTWEWDGQRWTARSPTNTPAPRDGHALAFDPIGRRILLFGGTDGALLDDTWAYDGVDWRRLNPTSRPPARARHAMATDRAIGRIVLFGGAGSTLLADTWTWDGTTWRQEQPATAPPARVHHALAFDAARGRVVLSGGRGSAGRLTDTWEWTGGTWHAIAASNAPPARQSHALASDVQGGRLIAFGGEDGIVYRSDTFALATDDPAAYEPLGGGCRGALGTAQLAPAAFSLPWTGDTFRVRATNLPPSGPVFMFTGFSATSWAGFGLPLDLGFVGMPGCPLRTAPDVGFPMTRNGATALWALPIPADPALAGLRFYNQALVFEPGANAAGATLSTARSGVVGNR